MEDGRRFFGTYINCSVGRNIVVHRSLQTKLQIPYILVEMGEIDGLDVPIKYGYESPVSFARAFQSLYEITPAMAHQAWNGSYSLSSYFLP